MGIQGPEREAVNLEPLPPGVEEGPLLGSYRLEAAFPEQKLQGRGEGPTLQPRLAFQPQLGGGVCSPNPRESRPPAGHLPPPGLDTTASPAP